MFFSSAPPVVEFVDFKKNRLVFLTRKPLRLGKDNTAKITLEKGASAVRVYVQQARQVDNGKLAYVAVVEDEFPFELPQAAPDAASLRAGQRFDVSLRVMSPDLPGYAGVTVDFSLTGLQLETREQVSVGKVVRIKLETHISELPWVEVSARVAWSRQEHRKAYRCGLQFVNVSEEQRNLLQEVERYLLARENANLTQLVIECADRYLLGYPTPEKSAEVEEGATV